MTKVEILALMQVEDVSAKIKAIHNFLTDHTNSFEDRKEVYLATPELLYTEHSWILHLEKFDAKYGEISWYDDFYCERYTTVNLVELCKELSERVDWPKEKQDDFICECVDKGYHSFVFDW